MIKMRLIPFIVFGIFFLVAITVACTPTAEQEAALEVATAVPTRIVTHTAVPTDTPTPTTTQTPTPLPTQTNTPTAIPTSTFTPTPIPTPEVIDSYASPNGEWVASLEWGYFAGEPNTELFHVMSSDGAVEWIVELTSEVDASMLGYIRPVPLFWSEDGQYMYYVHDAAGDGCGPESFGYDLYRLNLKNGENIELIPRGQWFAVAPNEEKVAFILRDELVIYDLETGEEVVAPFDLSLTHSELFPYYSNLVWSSDSTSLLVKGAENICATGLLSDGRVFIINVDPQSLTQNIIFDFSPWLEIVAWQEPDKVLLRVDDGDGRLTNAWLNPETGEITPANE